MRTTQLAAALLALGAFAMADAASLHDFTMKSIDGKDLPLASFKGKAVLVVNTASQ